MTITIDLEKYAPTTPDLFLGNMKEKVIMDDFLASHTSSPILIVIGQNGSGKSTFCNLFFSKYNANVIRVNYADFSSHKDLQSTLEKSIKTNSIMDIMTKRLKVVFLDDIESLFSQDRYANSYLSEMINTTNLSHYRVKVVITCVRTEDKRIIDIKKSSNNNVIYLTPPTLSELLPFLKIVCKKENICISDQDIIELCEKCKYNTRHILQNLSLYSSKSQNLNEAIEYFDTTVYDTVRILLSKTNFKCKDIEYILSSDPSIISFMMYDNYIPYLQHCQKHDNTDLHQIIDTYIQTSILEDHAYKHVEWQMLETIATLRCLAVHNSVSKHIKSIKQEQYNPTYTQIPTKCAQQYLNNKKVSNLLDSHKLSFHSFLNICDILYKSKKTKTKDLGEESAVFNLIFNNFSEKEYGSQQTSRPKRVVHKKV